MVLKNVLPKRNPQFDELDEAQLNDFREAVEAYNQVRADHELLSEAYDELYPHFPDFISDSLDDHSRIVQSQFGAVISTATRTAEDPSHALRLAAAAIEHWPLSNDHHCRAAASVIAADVVSHRSRITRLEAHLRAHETEERQQQEKALIREAMDDPDARQKAIRLIYDKFFSDVTEDPEAEQEVHNVVVDEAPRSVRTPVKRPRAYHHVEESPPTPAKSGVEQLLEARQNRGRAAGRSSNRGMDID